jgi:alkaline phosphatase
MFEQKMQTRREFFKGASMLGAASVLTGSGAQAMGTGTLGRAKNLIFLVADGMGTGTLSLAHHWNLRNTKRPLAWVQLLDDTEVIRSMQDTASASSPVTDSAAAGSAWGCGQRVNNGAINMTEKGESLEPILGRAKKAGKATGLVSTCRITHATPAAFAANVSRRNAEDLIASQYLERGIDVILGGGRRYFKTEERDLIQSFQAKGYRYCEDRAGLQKTSAEDDQLLGLFYEDHLPYALDRANDSAMASIPNLEAMFEAALRSLANKKDGFVLQVEGGRIDHAGHVNDAAAILHEQLEFDRCIETALRFCAKDPNTLLIVTTDHGTGGTQLNGAGKSYKDSGAALDRLNLFQSSLEGIGREVERTGVLDGAYFKSATGIELPDSKLAAFNKKYNTDMKYLAGVLADSFKTELMEATAVGWTSHNHTAENVELAALGPGGERIPPFIENHELHGFMCRALEI